MDRPLCDHCQRVIGVYEPAVVILPDGGERSGSYLTLGSALADPQSRALHARCRREETALSAVSALLAEH
ncbi:MAG: hypothetical protein ABR992_11325 [Solirubrobacteraceae bacterium]|jgi:hypothetical protein